MRMSDELKTNGPACEFSMHHQCDLCECIPTMYALCPSALRDRSSVSCCRCSSRETACHLASTSGRLRDQPRLHRCNHSTYTSRRAFRAVVCPGGARIVVVSSPPSDPSGGHGDALKGQCARAAPGDYGSSGQPRAAHSRPGSILGDPAPLQVRGRPQSSGSAAELTDSTYPD